MAGAGTLAKRYYPISYLPSRPSSVADSPGPIGNAGAGLLRGLRPFGEVYGLRGSGYNTGRRNCTFEWEVKTDGQRSLT